ncbi:molybdopterin-dependent oxidoreductase [Tropicimonas sp. IMCC34043]|uniref:molybdopterin-dependent oxidoreductase n=1 Tax=Tropicimonas sp. IMCC34043 TaxID=2248760 RepID=UPI000E267FAD|nr:molybdopterin-dependent oxidoreductase [Tropicimonas sp. IMCC34043]
MTSQTRRTGGTPYLYHSSHWGTFTAVREGDALRIQPISDDPDPSDILQNIPAALSHPARLARPLVRRGWLEDGPGPDPRRGTDGYVEMAWDDALDLAAKELARLGGGRGEAGEENAGRHVFGGSYGWSSAGRFHHAQSQVHRFLNVSFGGYVASVESYSSAAGSVILDTVAGNWRRLSREGRWWEHIRERTELVIAFGGLPLKNLAVSPGGNSRHIAAESIRAAAARGARFVSISALHDDFPNDCPVDRLAPRPATDVALMLGMAHRLIHTGAVDRGYLETYTTGWEALRAYIEGEEDGQPKTPDWAQAICGVDAREIEALADLAARSRTLITIAYGLQRAENGEQPVWMALALSCMLGGGVRRGAGFSYALGSMGNHGKPQLAVPSPTLPQGRNRSGDFIPVARIADLLLNPGGRYTYRGKDRKYGHIRLIYWAGGNPFHHHQHLDRLRKAFAKPDTIIVHDNVGTATTAHADIVFPATITAERDDIGASAGDPFLVPMKKLAEPYGEARDDFSIFCELSLRLGCLAEFSERRTAREWLEHLYGETRGALAEAGLPAPAFDTFFEGPPLHLPTSDAPSMMEAFHADPAANPLATPSGRIELFSHLAVAGGLPGHPAWIEPEEWLGSAMARTHPFQLVANQPAGKLHSQLDFGKTSMAAKIGGREVACMNEADAERLGIREGDVIRLWNARGAALAVARPSSGIAPSVIRLSTGAWYAPREIEGAGPACVNGNPNALTADRPASPLSQGCSGQLCLVSVERLKAPDPGTVPHENILLRPKRR